MRAMSLKLSDELDRTLSELAARRRTSKAALLREAIEAFARGEKHSVTALARDLAGCVHGPKDLSTATQHMEGYGQ